MGIGTIVLFGVAFVILSVLMVVAARSVTIDRGDNDDLELFFSG